MRKNRTKQGIILKNVILTKDHLNQSINDEMAPSFIWKEPFASVFSDPSYSLVRMTGLEPARLAAPAPKTGVSTISPHPRNYVTFNEHV